MVTTTDHRVWYRLGEVAEGALLDERRTCTGRAAPPVSRQCRPKVVSSRDADRSWRPSGAGSHSACGARRLDGIVLLTHLGYGDSERQSPPGLALDPLPSHPPSRKIQLPLPNQKLSEVDAGHLSNPSRVLVRPHLSFRRSLPSRVKISAKVRLVRMEMTVSSSTGFRESSSSSTSASALARASPCS